MANSTAIAQVYCVTNTINGKQYIGVTKVGVSARWAQHIQKAKRNPATEFHNSLNKNGAENFSVAIVASVLCEPWTVERSVIQSFLPSYNMTNGGEWTAGRTFTPEVRSKISRAHQGKKMPADSVLRQSQSLKQTYANNPEILSKAISSLVKARASVNKEKQKNAAIQSLKNRVWTPEMRNAVGQRFIGRKHPPSTLEKIAQKKRKVVECIDLNTVFCSVSEASASLGICISGISKVCLGKSEKAGGMKFRFCVGGYHQQ